MIDIQQTLRERLVQGEIPEEAIEPGMKILYSFARPDGFIDLNILNVQEVLNGILDNETRGFVGVLPNGQEGIFYGFFDHKLNLGRKLQKVKERIYDKDKALDWNNNDTNYANGTLFMSWRKKVKNYPKGIEEVVVDDKDQGIFIVGNPEALSSSLFVPGLDIIPDENTEEFHFIKGEMWGIKQKIVDGPSGSFKKLKYRQIPEDVYRHIVRAFF